VKGFPHILGLLETVVGGGGFGPTRIRGVGEPSGGFSKHVQARFAETTICGVVSEVCGKGGADLKTQITVRESTEQSS